MIQKPSDNQCSGSQHRLQNQKKERMSLLKFKVLLIVFFGIQGMVMAEWVPSGQTVNQQYYKDGGSTAYGKTFIGRSTTEPKCTTKSYAEEKEEEEEEEEEEEKKKEE
jgi:hypothetical protein